MLALLSGFSIRQTPHLLVLPRQSYCMLKNAPRGIEPHWEKPFFFFFFLGSAKESGHVRMNHTLSHYAIDEVLGMVSLGKFLVVDAVNRMVDG